MKTKIQLFTLILLLIVGGWFGYKYYEKYKREESVKVINAKAVSTDLHFFLGNWANSTNGEQCSCLGNQSTLTFANISDNSDSVFTKPFYNKENNTVEIICIYRNSGKNSLRYNEFCASLSGFQPRAYGTNCDCNFSISENQFSIINARYYIDDNKPIETICTLIKKGTNVNDNIISSDLSERLTKTFEDFLLEFKKQVRDESYKVNVENMTQFPFYDFYSNQWVDRDNFDFHYEKIFPSDAVKCILQARVNQEVIDFPYGLVSLKKVSDQKQIVELDKKFKTIFKEFYILNFHRGTYYFGLAPNGFKILGSHLI